MSKNNHIFDVAFDLTDNVVFDAFFEEDPQDAIDAFMEETGYAFTREEAYELIEEQLAFNY